MILESTFSNQWLCLFALCILLLGLSEVGFRVGLRLHKARDEARKCQIGGVQGAVLGLLGLLLGFTFAMAANRYDLRRELVLKEANAIGTTWLRAGLLPEAHRAPVKQLLLSYLEVRLKYETLFEDTERRAEGLRLSADIASRLWQHAESAAAEAPTPLTVSFITALNTLIDTDSERVTAARNRIPTGVWGILTLVAGFGCFTSSYGSGAQGARSVFTTFLLPGLIAIVTILVFDLSHSRQGVIGISQQPLSDLKASMRRQRARIHSGTNSEIEAPSPTDSTLPSAALKPRNSAGWSACVFPSPLGLEIGGVPICANMSGSRKLLRSHTLAVSSFAYVAD